MLQLLSYYLWNVKLSWKWHIPAEQTEAYYDQIGLIQVEKICEHKFTVSY